MYTWNAKSDPLFLRLFVTHYQPFNKCLLTEGTSNGPLKIQAPLCVSAAAFLIAVVHVLIGLWHRAGFERREQAPSLSSLEQKPSRWFFIPGHLLPPILPTSQSPKWSRLSLMTPQGPPKLQTHSPTGTFHPFMHKLSIQSPNQYNRS